MNGYKKRNRCILETDEVFIWRPIYPLGELEEKKDVVL